MTAPAAPRRRRRVTSARARAGAILLEVLVSLALFVGAAAFVLGACRSALGQLERTRLETLAADVARSVISELEAGLVNVPELTEAGEGLDRLGTLGDEIDVIGLDAWRIDLQTERTEYEGLTLVAVTASMDDEPRATFTLRQLVRLREREPPPYETDPLIDGLPTREEVAEEERRRGPRGGEEDGP